MNKRTEQEYLEMLENTVKYYSEDILRRAVKDSDYNNGCVYLTEDGRNCAVGRWINYDNFDLECHNEENSITDLLIVENEEAFIYTDEELFVPEAQGFNHRFWGDLQDLHDSNKFWDKAGLTDEGQIKVNKIKERLEVGYYGDF